MDRTLDRNNIADRINTISKKRFNIDIKAICDNYETEELLGKKIGLGPRELVYLFFEIEREFDIKLPQEDIYNNGFATLQGITDIILSQSSKAI